MFAPTFDSFKRRAEKTNPDMEIKKLCTAYTNSEDFAAYYAVYDAGTNEKLHVTFEEDSPSIATFYIVTSKPTPQKQEATV